MAKNLFSVPIFFIVFRETLEAAIIISVLLGLAEQIVHESPTQSGGTATHALAESSSDGKNSSEGSETVLENGSAQRHQLIRKLRLQIFMGAGLGLLISISIGAAFIAVWFTKATDLWSKSEGLWEGIFRLIACLMILVMGITMLKMDRAKATWRIKLQRAFEGKKVDGKAKSGKWVLFILPFVTVLREGLEAVIFVGGVSLGQPATSIPIATIVGLLCGFIVGFLIYEFASRTTLTLFLVIMTNFLLLIGAGLFSQSVSSFEGYAYSKLLGIAGDDAGGNGPGSYPVKGNVWHLDCCNPNNKGASDGWTIFGAVFGWTNSATLGTVLSYVFYWLVVIVVLVYLKFKEGRTNLMGRESAAGVRRRRARDVNEIEAAEREAGKEKDFSEEDTNVEINVIEATEKEAGKGKEISEEDTNIETVSR